LNTYNKQQNISNWKLEIVYRFTTWLWEHMCNCFLKKYTHFWQRTYHIEKYGLVG
jgi:hypothetical protein